jgi:SNF2 family DNA or RNA helicase
MSLAELYDGDLIVGGDRRIDRFEAGTTRLLFGTIDAMGEGLNLQQARIAIFLDSHWSATKMTQAIDRIHRITADEAKVIYLLHSCREDKMVLDALDHKWTEEELVYHYLNDSGESVLLTG